MTILHPLKAASPTKADRGICHVSRVIWRSLIQAISQHKLNRVNKRLWRLLLLVAFSTCSAASNEKYIFTNISVERNIANPNVLKVLQDRQGFIWAATQDGLNRYDGYEFVVYRHNPDDPHSLADIYINSIYLDDRGELWVGTDHGLSRYNQASDNFTNYQHNPDDPKSLSHNIVMSISQGGADDLWVATLGGGLNRFDLSSQQFTHYKHDPQDNSSISDNNLYSLLTDSFGVLWIGTRNAGLNRFDAKTQSFKRYIHDPSDPTSISHNKVYSLLEDQGGDFWVGTRGGGLNRLDRGRDQFEHFRHQPQDEHSLGSDLVFAIYADNKNNLWVGTHNGGLNRLDKTNRRFIRYQNNPTDRHSLGDNDVYSITQDNSGLIWLGTLGGGLSHFDPASERFSLMQHEASNPQSITAGVVWAVLKDSQGIVWVGTDHGLNRIDRRGGKIERFVHDPNNPQTLSDNDVRAIVEDDKGQLWIGTANGGMNRLASHLISPSSNKSSKLNAKTFSQQPINQQTAAFVHYQHSVDDPASLSDNHVSAIHQDKMGRLWVGTQNGLNRLDNGGQFSRFSHDPEQVDSLSQNDISALYSAQDGALWVGTLGGLNRFDRAMQKFTRFQTKAANENSLSHNSINAITQDAQGIFWIGTSGGLNRFDFTKKQFQHYRVKQGLLSDRVYAVMIDENNQFWLGEDGISVLQPQTGKIINNIGRNAGCQGANQGAYFQADDGEILMGAIGFCGFYPLQALRSSSPPAIALTDFRLLNKSVVLKNIDPDSPLEKVINHTPSLQLSYRDNVLSFEFAALHYVAPQSNRYRYKLENFNQDWIETGADNRRATFTNLSPGDYIFRVKAANNEGQWNDIGRSLKLTIVPPIWQTWWAYTIYLLALLVIIYRIVHSHQLKLTQARARIAQEQEVVRQLQRLDKLKDEFLTNTSHEFRTPLNGIIGISESMIYGASGELPQEAKDNLHLVVNCGLRLSDLVNDILDFAKLKSNSIQLQIKPLDIYQAATVTVALASNLAKDKSLALINRIPSGLPLVKADENRLQQILFNLIGNAIKFTEKGNVSITAEPVNGFIKVTVSDTGIGIAATQLDEIFESFHQLDSSYNRLYQGTGLGLSITKQLVELHGGIIDVRSTLNKGTSFWFLLPVSE